VSGSFDDFVAARGDALWQLAYLLVGDGRRSEQPRAEERAEALVEGALSRAYPRWADLAGTGAAEAGVRRELLAAYLDQAGPDPSPADGVRAGPTSDDTRAQALGLLAALTPPQRAALVLRGLAVPPWEAADALDVSSAELLALEAAARTETARLSARAAVVLERLDEVAPDPPDAADRSARAQWRAARVRRRRRSAAVGVALLVVALVAVPVLVSGEASTGGSATPTSAPAGSQPPVAERLVDQLPIPSSCARLADRPEPPAYPYEPSGAGAVWLRFCPPLDLDGELDAVPFAPDITVTDSGAIDRLLDGWLASDEGPSPCDYSAFAYQGTVRMQVGTLDGQLHVADLRIGTCGTASLDGRLVGVDGRTAFAAAVSLVGDELAEPVVDSLEAAATTLPTPSPAGSPAPPSAGQVASCPAAPAGAADLARTTTPDYPRVRGLPMPLPATSALVCRYPPPGSPAARLGPGDAELLRAAYLARSTASANANSCPRLSDTTRYAVVLTDRTGSRRAFTVDLGDCGRVRQRGQPEGVAGPWLTEALSLDAPAT